MKKLFFLFTFLLLSFCSFSQSRYIPKITKQIVYTRDGGVCQCCGSSLQLEYDHIIPFSCGGNSSIHNVQLLCRKCNRSKSNSCYCKVHNRKIGHDCCQQNVKKKSTSSTRQCSATTKRGARCKKRTSNSSGRCHLH